MKLHQYVKKIVSAALVLVWGAPHAMGAPAPRPVVVELFTSQGCSSCPAADAILERLAREPGVIALSYHITYWDYLGWKDPFALPESTERQKAYAKILRDHIYTPQVVVDGASIGVGSDESFIRQAMSAAIVSQPFIPVHITRDGDDLAIDVAGAAADAGVTVPMLGTVWAMLYREHDKTTVSAGENQGRVLSDSHNVARIIKLGVWQRNDEHYRLPLSELGGHRIAVILQAEGFSRVAGAASYP